MTDLVLTTFDWVPETPRGYVRDIRVRWALEEAGLPYRVKSVPFGARGAEHFSHQPFGQVPWCFRQNSWHWMWQSPVANGN
jgi:glutathione S-transferase